LALDEPKDTDDIFEQDGYRFLVDKDLMIKAQEITVDLTYMGFQVRSKLELGGGGSCGSSCSSGSCSV
jgi:Fe-S cluster assembly iron-binding protein IscA